MPFKETKNLEEEPFHHSVEAGLLGRKSNEERLPIDDEEYIGEKPIIEDTLHTYEFGQNLHNTCKSLERVDTLPSYSLRPEPSIHLASKPGSFILPKKAFGPAEPVRMAMKPVLRTNTGNNTMSSGPYSPTSLRIINLTDPINLNDGSSVSTTLYDSELTDVTASSIRVMQPTSTKTVITSTTTTVMSPINNTP
jgi:hypothetical protein